MLTTILLFSLLLLTSLRVYVSYFAPHPMGSSMTIGTREVQEDFYFHDTNKGVSLLVVADGNGETYAGRIASQTAVRTFRDLFSGYNVYENPKYFFKKAFNSANRGVLHQLDNGQKGYSSLTAAMIVKNKLYYATVGNVKLFVFRKGDLIAISTGHTLEMLGKEEFSQGKLTRSRAISLLEDARLYNYLGQEDFRDLELFDEAITLEPKDIVLLASDGIYDLLSVNEIETALKSSKNMQKVAFRLIENVNQHKNEDKDNACVVLCKIGDVL